MMELNEYQQKTANTAIYPGANKRTGDGINYTLLGLVGEAGECANSWKKGIRDSDVGTARAKLRFEVGDVLWYLARLCSELGISLEDVAHANLAKLDDRKTRGVLQGSGDNR